MSSRADMCSCYVGLVSEGRFAWPNCTNRTARYAANDDRAPPQVPAISGAGCIRAGRRRQPIPDFDNAMDWLRGPVAVDFSSFPNRAGSTMRSGEQSPSAKPATNSQH